jgi:hypothetical protein
MQGPGQSLMLTSLTLYFDKRPEQRTMLRDMVEGTFPISLRLLDWFVTHYARHRQIVYWINDGDKTMVEAYPGGAAPLRKFHLYLEYRAQLKSYSKHAFDPFRRHDRISFIVTPAPLTVVETTVGQLNFFRWAFQNHVVEYILRHTADIEEDMCRFAHERRAAPKKAEAAAPAPSVPLAPAAPPVPRTKAAPALVHQSCRIMFE